MVQGMTAATMIGQKRAALRELGRWRAHLEPRLAEHPAAVPWAAVEAGLLGLLPQMPDPGWRAPTMRSFSISGCIYIAVYLALAARDVDPAGAWAICEAATRARFDGMGRLERAAASRGMFSFVMQALARSLDARSRVAPVGGWIARFIAAAGDGYGVDYQRCAIHDLALRAGAGDFAPFICNADAIGSEIFGWGLTRSETLAQGGRRCDFRFTRGGPTRVRLHVLGQEPR